GLQTNFRTQFSIDQSDREQEIKRYNDRKRNQLSEKINPSKVYMAQKDSDKRGAVIDLYEDLKKTVQDFREILKAYDESMKKWPLPEQHQWMLPMSYGDDAGIIGGRSASYGNVYHTYYIDGASDPRAVADTIARKNGGNHIYEITPGTSSAPMVI
ncbi:MAG: hypothetical protein LIP28_09630, partial [Deltaproteobacteria bacterium]|nr:hypothetical protein [Deltaproteobacteria bacterium]